MDSEIEEHKSVNLTRGDSSGTNPDSIHFSQTSNIFLYGTSDVILYVRRQFWRTVNRVMEIRKQQVLPKPQNQSAQKHGGGTTAYVRGEKHVTPESSGEQKHAAVQTEVFRPEDGSQHTTASQKRLTKRIPPALKRRKTKSMTTLDSGPMNGGESSLLEVVHSDSEVHQKSKSPWASRDMRGVEEVEFTDDFDMIGPAVICTVMLVGGVFVAKLIMNRVNHFDGRNLALADYF